ncbi:MAG TPA: aminomethyl-transferring glycine dehydrogenase subunit GcvPA [Acholeplasma sp.]|nr:aminomethyl-transferring glycine dehydrogenase subunit GcvPA [Acholeplasma sp.]
MFKYFPHTKSDVKLMLDKIGIQDLDDLFSSIPKTLGTKVSYDLPSSMSENTLRRFFRDHANNNKQLISFRGGGVYDHYIPSVIKAIISREEFLTSYTPYQPEIAQGTLQYIFEFQSMITNLTGMDVSNASMYDGATAAAEAMFMACAQTKSKRFLVSDLLFEEVIEVIKTYALYRDIEIIMVKSVTGFIDLEHLKEISNEAAGFIGQIPNKFGLIEDLSNASAIIKEQKGLMIINSDPSILGVIKSPKNMGADIACGHLQSLGMPMSFGGAHAGFLATTKTYMRKMPGRICGLTTDVDGKRGFVLTLQAREQHIRREKANSNICSNQSLMALWATVYLSLMGKEGIKEVNQTCFKNSHYLEEKLIETGLFEQVFKGFYIKEFVLKTNVDLDGLESFLLKRGYLSGLKIDQNLVSFSSTEQRTKKEIDEFVGLIVRYSNESI